MSRNHRERRIPPMGALVLAVSLITTGCLGLGKDNDASKTVLSVSGSATGQAAFQAGFWQFARTNCSGCHGATQTPLFAIADAGQAYQYARSSNWIDFNDPNNSDFAIRAGDSHCGQSNCVGKTATVEPLLQDWATAELTGPAGPGGPGPGTPPAGIKFYTQALAVPASVANGTTTGATFVPMRWQLNQISPANALLGNSLLEIEIQFLNANTYRMRNPKIVGLTGAVLLKGMHVLIRRSTDPAPGAEDPLGDGWKGIAVNVQPRAIPNPLPATPMTPAQAAVIDPNAQGENILSGSDVITIGFDDLTAGSVVPALGPTFASIFGNIIQPKCLGCHSGGAPSGGVSLVNYAAVSGSVVAGNPNTSILYTAVVSGNPLMPFNATPLTTAERTAISGWITAGALNN